MLVSIRARRPSDTSLCLHWLRPRPGLAAPLVAILAVLLPSAPVQADSGCRPPPAVLRFAAPIPVLAKAIKTAAPVRIVAFGSSSTAGAGASSGSKTYPARLQAALSILYPSRQISVVNKGRGGELITQMLVRMDRDVLAEKPTLVIWQTGVNDAIRKVDVEKFRADLDTGVKRLLAAGTDVILLDQQYYPKARKDADYKSYIDVVHEVAAKRSVPVFRRYELMAYLVESAQYRIDELLAPDQFHQNDLSYDCLGATLASALRARLDPPPAPLQPDKTNRRWPHVPAVEQARTIEQARVAGQARAVGTLSAHAH